MILYITARAVYSNEQIRKEITSKGLKASIVKLAGVDTVEVECGGKDAVGIQNQFKGRTEIEIQVGGVA